MKKLLREPEQYDNKKTIRGKKELEGLITLRNVSFRYNSGSKYALWDFSYSFLKGLHYGVVGVNGSGKTTLIKILLGLYMPDHGYIVSNVEDFNVLFQDFQKYPITVREYVIMGNDTAITDIQIWQILKKLDIGYLKDGLDTVLMLETDNGTGLSGGQYQKLAIARAFLSKAELIILDEPTSSLDPISEKEIYLKCREVFAGRTTLFISHRLGAVRHMDKILVLNYGKLCEEGTHFSLMKKNGIYKKMYETQKGLYIDERECM